VRPSASLHWLVIVLAKANPLRSNPSPALRRVDVAQQGKALLEAADVIEDGRGAGAGWVAAATRGYRRCTRGGALLREAIKLGPSFLEPRVQLARFLNKARPREADQVIDEAIVANPRDRPAAGRPRFSCRATRAVYQRLNTRKGSRGTQALSFRPGQVKGFCSLLE